MRDRLINASNTLTKRCKPYVGWRPALFVKKNLNVSEPTGHLPSGYLFFGFTHHSETCQVAGSVALKNTLFFVSCINILFYV